MSVVSVVKTFKIVTLGCKVNTYESEAISNIFLDNGYVRREDVADVVIINTCSVTSTSDSKSRQRIRHEINNNPGAVICVMGCYSQVRAEEVRNINGVSIVIGTKYRHKLFDLVEKYYREQKQIVLIEDSNTFKEFEDLSVINYFSNTRAYLKIQDGCNNFCSYCIIPYTRGRVRSKNPDLIINEANNLAQKGYKEMVLTGIHTGGYGIDFDNYRFADLLEDIAKEVKGIERIRISSIEIHELSDRILSLINKNRLFVNHFHIPLQSGCDSTLKRMNRKYDTTYFLDRVNKIKDSIIDCNLTTDVIVGFPGETDEEFKNTCDFIEKIGFTKIHVFPFSSREGTVAAKMQNQVPGNIKKERVNKLIELSKKLGKKYYSKFIGEDIDVLFETYDENTGMISGYSSNYIKIQCLGDKCLLNTISKVKLNKLIEKDSDYEVEGELVK